MATTNVAALAPPASLTDAQVRSTWLTSPRLSHFWLIHHHGRFSRIPLCSPQQGKGNDFQDKQVFHGRKKQQRTYTATNTTKKESEREIEGGREGGRGDVAEAQGL